MPPRGRGGTGSVARGLLGDVVSGRLAVAGFTESRGPVGVRRVPAGAGPGEGAAEPEAPPEGDGSGVRGCPGAASDPEPPSHGADAVPGPGRALFGRVAALAPGPGLRRLPPGRPPRPPQPLRPFPGESRQAGRQRRPERRKRHGPPRGLGLGLLSGLDPLWKHTGGTARPGTALTLLRLRAVGAEERSLREEGPTADSSSQSREQSLLKRCQTGFSPVRMQPQTKQYEDVVE